MRKKDYGTPSFLKAGKRILVGTLALSLAMSGTVWASLNRVFDNGTKAQGSILMGDADLNGSVELADANLVLKAALNITSLTGDAKTAADVDFNGHIELADANLILKAALKITTLPTAPPSSETPAPSDAVTETPTPTPAPTTAAPSTTPPTPIPTYEVPSALPDVSADPANVVTGEQIQVLEPNGATYYSNDGIIEFADQEEGAELVNPFAGKAELKQTVQQATSLEAEEGKENCWTLSGASFTVQKDVEFAKLDPRIYNQEDKSTVTYTRPVWTNGVTVSFWLKADSSSHADPILTFANDNLTLMVRMNGSVRFIDGNNGANYLNNGSANFLHGIYGEWNYYTITIANDWVQIYVNGQENLFTSLELSRKKIQDFNDGFLTRYNSIGEITEEDVQADVRKYYVKSGEWYYNGTYEKYMYHDNFSVFGNARFRGANCGNKLIMDLITDEDTQMWIGGADTNVGTTYTAHVLAAGSRAAGLTAYMDELTPEQIAANYEAAATPNPTPTLVPETPTPTPSVNPDVSATPIPTQDPYEGLLVPISSLNQSATYNADSNAIVFGEATGSAVDKIKGVEMTNPFAGITQLKSTLEDALSGQAIFPYKDKNGYSYLQNGAGTGLGGWDRMAVQVFRGNFYDVYYGDIYEYGSDMTPKTGADTNMGTKADLMTLEQLETAYGNQKTTFHRPVWTSGASVSFWVKPVEVDDSPLLTFFQSNNMALYVDVRGDVGYFSLNADDWTKGVKDTGEPKNTFAVLGNPDMVKAGEWNFYTITIANDWIQVYVNGQEMVYEYVNLNRTETKKFNKGYLTRYNTIGIWTKDMVAAFGDSSGKTLEGVDRNYLTKSGMIWDLNAAVDAEGDGPLSDKNATNTGKDGASIRANNVYENPFNSITSGGNLLMDTFIGKKVQMFIGGVYTILDNGKYTFSSVKVKDGTDANLVNYIPVDADGDGVTDTGARKKIFATAHTMNAGTQVIGVKRYMKELTAEQVKACYEYAVAEKDSPVTK